MTINALASSSSLAQLLQLGSTNASSSPRACEKSDASAPPSGPPPGGLVDAIVQALSEIGATDSSSTDSNSSTSTDDVTAALQSFIQNLLSAMHAQSDSSTTDQSSTDNGSDVSTDFTGGRMHGDIVADLQSLIQQLSSSSADSTDSEQSDLQKSFQNLVSALGGDGSQATLGDFLQAFASHLPDANSIGNVVDTQV